MRSLVILLALTVVVTWGRPSRACTPAPECHELEPIFPLPGETVPVDSLLLFRRREVQCTSFEDSSVVPELRRADGTLHELTPIVGGVYRPLRGLDPDAPYEVVLRISSSTMTDTFTFATSAGAPTQPPLIDELLLTLSSEEVEGRKGGVCGFSTSDSTVVQATVHATFSGPSDVGYVIEVGFARDETSAAISFYPVDPANPQTTVHQSFAVRGSEPFRARMGLGDYDRWPGPNICVAVRLLRHDTTASNCHHPVDSCLVPTEMRTVCEAKPAAPSGCSTTGSSGVEPWLLLGLLAWMGGRIQGLRESWPDGTKWRPIWRPRRFGLRPSGSHGKDPEHLGA